MKSRWLHLLITIFIIFSYMQFEYVRYCMECDAGYQEYSYANAVINIVGDRYLILLVSGIQTVSHGGAREQGQTQTQPE